MQICCISSGYKKETNMPIAETTEKQTSKIHARPVDIAIPLTCLLSLPPSSFSLLALKLQIIVEKCMWQESYVMAASAKNDD